MSLGWDTSFHLNGKFPLQDNTIFNTVDSALNFIRDVNSSAIAGTIIGVTDSSNISSSGIYEIFNDNGKLALRKLATLEQLRESVSNVQDLITNQSGNYDAKLAELAAKQTQQLEALRNEIFSPDGETAPITRTMMLQVGSDSTNYRFSTSEIGEKDADGIINSNGILQFLSGTLFHFSITQENSSSAKQWNVSNEYIIEDADRNESNQIEFFNLKSIPLGESLWIYFQASKNGTNAKWYISPIKYAWNEVGVPGLVNGNSDYYYLLYGYCGYTKQKNAFFEPLYGNTWIKGSTIYTGKVQSMDGASVMDLDNNTFNLGNEFNYTDGQVVIGDVNKSAFVLNKDSESGELQMHFGKKIDSKWEGMTFADGKLTIGKYDDQIKNLQSQIDNDIQTWFGKGYPIPYFINTGDNYIIEGKNPIITLSSEGKFTMEGVSPEISIDEDPNHHLGDIFINLVDSSSWRFIKDEDNQFKWQFISDEALSSVYKVLGDLDRQIDNKITTWVQSNDPQVDWYDDPKEEETWEKGKEYKKYHLGDLWYDTDTKEAKQYTLSAEKYTWIPYDGGTSIFDFVDGKRTIYNNYDIVAKDGYHIGDWWCLENNSDEIESILDNSYTDAAGNPIYLQGQLLVAIKDKDVEFNWNDWEILQLNPKEVQNEVTKIKNDVDTIKTALDIVQDGQTEIGDSFVQTMMLRIGADSTNYILQKTSTSGSKMTNLYWDGNFLKVQNPDIMIHSSYTWKSTTSNGNKWNISKSEFECEVSEENSVDPIYIYIEASRDSNKAFWKYAVEPQPLFFTDENGQGDFYNFPFATIIDQSTKTLIEVRGNTKIIGDRIITGKLESNTGNSYFDLDNGTFVLGKSESQSGSLGMFSYDGKTVHIDGAKTETESKIWTYDEITVYSAFQNEGIHTLDYDRISVPFQKVPGKYKITKGEIIEEGGYDANSEYNKQAHIEIIKESDSTKTLINFGDYFTIESASGPIKINLVYGPIEPTGYPIIEYDNTSGSGTIGINIKNVSLYKKQIGFDSETARSLSEILNLGSTDISGGLVLTNAIGVRNSTEEITAGISGISNEDNTVAFWAGATLENKETAPVKLTYTGIGSTIGPFKIKDSNTMQIIPTIDKSATGAEKNKAEITISNSGEAKIQLFKPNLDRFNYINPLPSEAAPLQESVSNTNILYNNPYNNIDHTLVISSESLNYTNNLSARELITNYNKSSSDKFVNLGGAVNTTLKSAGATKYNFDIYTTSFSYTVPKSGYTISESKHELSSSTITLKFNGWTKNSTNTFNVQGTLLISINEKIIYTNPISITTPTVYVGDSGKYFNLKLNIPKIEKLDKYLQEGENILKISFNLTLLQRNFGCCSHYTYVIEGKGGANYSTYRDDITITNSGSVTIYAGYLATISQGTSLKDEEGQISTEGFSFSRGNNLIAASVGRIIRTGEITAPPHYDNLYVIMSGLPTASSSDGMYFQLVCDAEGRIYKKQIQ